MQKSLCVFTTALVLSGAWPALTQQVPSGPVPHGPFVAKALTECHLVSVKLTKSNAIKDGDTSSSVNGFWDRYAHAVTELGVIADQKSQGGEAHAADGMDEMLEIQIRFYELYPEFSDDTLFALSNSNIIYAPSSTFAGLVVYDSHGKQEARVIGKAKKWYSGVTEVGGQLRNRHSYYTTVLINESHGVASTPSHIVYAKWGDIKNKIAFDATTEKMQEDTQLERDALTR